MAPPTSSPGPRMRKINTRSFRLATRQTQREVNRRIVLNLIREFQPISRSELARRMKVRRGALTILVRELLESGAIVETGEAAVVRGRRPMLLSLRSTDQLIAAADVRPGRTYVALAEVSGRIVANDVVETPEDPERVADLVAAGLDALVAQYTPGATVRSACIGAGVVVPGMIDRKTGRLLYSPRLGWRDVELRGAVAERLGVKTYIESAPIACALARLWLSPEETMGVSSFAYVHVSDGVGVGLVLNGEPIRGETHSAGEFGHVPLDLAGPECVCGRRGCFEALACNATTVARYAERVRLASGDAPVPASVDDMPAVQSAAKLRKPPPIPIDEVVRRARRGEPAAVAALTDTARYIGRGLSIVVSAFNPGRIFLGGELGAAWDIIEQPIREAIAAGAVTPAAGAVPVVPDGSPGKQRLKGAVALVNAPSFAALSVG